MAKKSELAYQKTKELLIERGVDFNRLAKLVVDLQIKHSPNITESIALENIEAVLRKREVQNAIMTGISIDKMAEQKLLPEPLQEMVEKDDGLYGIDEAVAISIANCYGSIAISNFGYLDISKPGIISEYNGSSEEMGAVHTFLDDLLSAIVAASCSRFAHNQEKADPDL